MKELAQSLGKVLAQWVIAVFGFDAAHRAFAQEKTARMVGTAAVAFALVWACVERFLEWRARERAKPKPAVTMGGMKLPLFLFLTSAWVAQGCFSLGPLQPARERLAQIANEAAYQATRARLVARRDELPALSAIEGNLNALIAQRNYEPKEFARALHPLPGHELRGEQARLVVIRHVVVLEPEGNAPTKADSRPRTKTILGAVHLGINRALAEFAEPLHPH